MEKEIKLLGKKIYITPDIEPIEIETEQNILANGSTIEMPGEDW
ncbi:MAG: hypothetical protein PHN55_09850 [Dysgonamonadaceae bacterium]|nr:hypothetical protein [Dysgonamonadaceae bacterium]